MYYTSIKTAMGNVGVSYTSQEEADAQAEQMDANNCRNCSNCSNCSYCSECRSCSGVLIWRGGDASHLLAINGLRWSVAISQDRMQIGCQNHTHHEWNRFDDEMITSMDVHALAFWQEHKAMLMAMCAVKAKEDTE